MSLWLAFGFAGTAAAQGAQNAAPPAATAPGPKDAAAQPDALSLLVAGLVLLGVLARRRGING